MNKERDYQDNSSSPLSRHLSESNEATSRSEGRREKKAQVASETPGCLPSNNVRPVSARSIEEASGDTEMGTCAKKRATGGRRDMKEEQDGRGTTEITSLPTLKSNSPHNLEPPPSYVMPRNPYWEFPFAPDRLAKPVCVKYKSNFSIGCFLSPLLSSIFDLEAQVCSQADVLLFPEWKCLWKEMEEVEDGQVHKYLPGKEEPITFKIASSGDNPSKKQRLARFKSSPAYLIDGGIITDVIINVGGPMYNLAWCPQPFGFSQHPPPEIAHTFLAVTAHKHMGQVHSIGVVSRGYNMIQIWDLGYLTNMGIFSSNDSAFEPFMTLGILHDGSSAMDLAWCPRGSPHPNRLEDWSKSTSDSIPRLGMLTAVLADGSCNIYAVPHPIFLRMAKGVATDDRESIFLNLKPVYQLIYSDHSMPLKVCWSHHDNCQLLSVGCTDGTMDIWELPTRLELAETSLQPVIPDTVTLRQGGHSDMETDVPEATGCTTMEDSLYGDDEQGIAAILMKKIPFTRVPIWRRKAHPSPIRALVWHPSNRRFLATGAMDSSAKVWDMNVVDTPLTTIPIGGGTVLDMAWAGRDNDYALLVACDEGSIRHFGPNCSRVYDFHRFGCWGIGLSPILSLQASCDTQGKVYCMLLPDKRSKFGGVEVCIEHVRLESDDSKKTEKNDDSIIKAKKNSEIIICSDHLPNHDDASEALDSVLTFEESSVHCANRVTPAPPKGTTSKEKRERLLLKKGKIRPPEKLQKSKPVLRFKDPLLTLYKVRWNPNTIAPSWVAYGGMAGLVRVQLLAWTKPF